MEILHLTLRFSFRWMYFDLTQSPVFECLYALTIYQLIWAGMTMISYDSLFLGFGLTIVEGFKTLQNEIRNSNLKSKSLKIGKLVDRHNKLMKCAGHYCDSFQLGIFVRFLACAISICMLGYTFLATNDFERKVFCVNFLSVVILNLFITNYVSQKLTDEVR